MNREESDRIHELCGQIAVEQDQARFVRLLTELNRLLSTAVPQPQTKPPDTGKE
jgi:hypothetical protein